MGWVLMSERELNRVEVLAQVDDGQLSVDNAALTRRQIFRLLKRYRQDGVSAIRHKSRGRAPNNQIHTVKRDYALSLIKEQYPAFGPTLAAEMLAEHHGFKVPRRVAQWRAVLQPSRSSNPDRAMAHPLQYGQAAQRTGLSSASARKYCDNGPKTDDALTIKPDHPMGARQNQFGTLTISDNPPFFGDVLAWRAFEEIVREDGIRAFYNRKERRKLGL